MAGLDPAISTFNLIMWEKVPDDWQWRKLAFNFQV
jgi:hypothetical protein